MQFSIDATNMYLRFKEIKSRYILKGGMIVRIK